MSSPRALKPSASSAMQSGFDWVWGNLPGVLHGSRRRNSRVCYNGVTRTTSDGRLEPDDPLELFFIALKWGWLIALGIFWILPPLGFLLFVLWLIMLLGSIMGFITCIFSGSSRKAHASAARLWALKAPRAANGRFIRASMSEGSATERAS